MFKSIFKTVLVGAACIVSAPLFAAQVQVLDDYDNEYFLYSSFFASKGQAVSRLMHDFSGVDLSMNSLVIASLPSSFSAGELADLTSYVYGGGRLVLASENAENFPSQIGVLNSALSSLGSTITNDNTTYDAGFGTTSNIADNPFTVGVNNINYAFTSSLSGGTVLVQGASGQNLVSYDRIGAGYLFVIADSNLGDGLSNSAYGNGQLFLNFENVSVSAVPLPASAPLFGAALMVLGAFGYGLKRKQIAASA